MIEPTERELSFVWDGQTLAGTLHLPEGDGPHPVVLMMQGSGDADRDCDGYFPPIRNAFLGAGLGTYAFDKPGCGDSTGDWRRYGLEDRAKQVLDALQILRDDASIAGDRVGVWGQSQGGWLAQIVAGRDSQLCFAISNSGPSITVAEQNLYGCEHAMRELGHSEDEIGEALVFVERLHDAARRRLDFAALESEILSEARTQSWYGYATIDSPEDWAFGSELAQEDYEPLEAVALVRCPFLAVFGGRDVLVPAWRGAEEVGNALHRAGNPAATVVVFPDGDHRIGAASSDGFVPGYLDLISDWAARRL